MTEDDAHWRILQHDAERAAHSGSAGEVFKRRQDVLKLLYHHQITEDMGNRLLAILTTCESCG